LASFEKEKRKDKSSLKILGTGTLTLSKSHTGHPQTLGITVRNSVARATWHSEFVRASNIQRPFPSLFNSPFT